MPQVMEDFAGMEAGAGWDDAKFILGYKDNLEKMAMAGGPQWGLMLFAPLVQGEAGAFAAGQLPQAWKWIRA